MTLIYLLKKTTLSSKSNEMKTIKLTSNLNSLCSLNYRSNF